MGVGVPILSHIMAMHDCGVGGGDMTRLCCNTGPLNITHHCQADFIEKLDIKVARVGNDENL